MGYALKILGRTSSINVRKVLWTCQELSIPYEREDWGIGFTPTQSPEFLALNPNAQVPVIVDDNGVLWESNTICRYLAGLHQRHDLLPTAPAPRARVEQWMDWQATELNPSWGYAFHALVRQNPDFQDPQRIAAGVRGWNDKMGLLEQQLRKTGAYVAGDDFTLADILLGLSVHRWRMTPMARPSYPAVDAYYALLSQRPGFQAFALNGHN
ncbi:MULTISPECIES: glutathione S-transferase family protein [Pseudomonas]|uniref:Glutathione S-transferase n=1 Tax=Pseudomonas gessardii TaxID=78544 RepID=A0ABS9FFU7_9PSED|nr:MULTISPECIES: glutathione S-transferase [Pseudomonas]MBH3425116.1 glutathione S-transferase [Pseudomonas gessardii]MCF4981692.1 glutathione S-transferase [Pseudomonas gessardii]MCF4991189.1 glutathione S-transferase [Pseudomonas gessardii]MCF5087669.1 glutathione S-transferase [Pseudomonas gessardii]MCF5097713.1 glutathione S-transferase [Pseudomonas gessardii]